MLVHLFSLNYPAFSWIKIHIIDVECCKMNIPMLQRGRGQVVHPGDRTPTKPTATMQSREQVRPSSPCLHLQRKKLLARGQY